MLFIWASYLKFIFIFDIKKSVKPCIVARSTHRGLRIAMSVETSNAEPTLICIYKWYV